MKKTIFIGIILLVSCLPTSRAAWQYISSGGDNPNGRLYYTIINGVAEIAAPNAAPVGWDGYEEYMPTGNITIPDYVPRSTGGSYPVKKIRGQAFVGCTGLVSVSIPYSVEEIEFQAFFHCSNLSRVICDEVSIIGREAFAGCSNLSNINYGQNIVSIEQRAFIGCSSLTSINIPSTITSLGTDSFKNCTGINYISIAHFDPPSIGVNSELPFSATQHVPCGSEQAYRSHSYWGNFARIISDCDNIEDVGICDIRIYSTDSHIVVIGTTDEVRVFDMVGRNVRNEVLPAGVYLVKIGERPARKVIVMQ